MNAHPLRISVGITMAWLCVVSLYGCGTVDHAKPAGTTQLRLAWPSAGPFATELAAAYRRLTDIDVAIVQDPDALRAVAEGRADITVTLADMAYFAHRDAPALRAIAALEVIPVQIVVREGSPIETLSDFRGRSFATIGVTRATSLVFDAAGLAGKVTYAPIAAKNAAGLMREGGPDGLIVVSYFPNVFVQAALREGGRLLPIDGDTVERARRAYPFIRRTTIPANTYPGQTQPLRTVGTNMLYICRQELAEQVVHTLAEGLFRALPQLSERIQPLRLVNVEAASAVPIPLHEGAARYYREREVQ